jgi:hypothetical protein
MWISLHNVVMAVVPTIIGILTSLVVIQPLSRGLGVTGLVINSVGDLFDLRLKSEWSFSVNEAIVWTVCIVIHLITTFLVKLWLSVRCDCVECRLYTYNIHSLLDVCLDYIKFPARYILDIPMRVDDDGGMVWGLRNVYLRRGDRPTVITRTGAEEWRKGSGQLDRSGDKPAYISPVTSHMMWYRNGVLDREYGPASVWSDGVVYYSNGVVHRSNDEPAIFGVSYVEWWTHGVNMRNDTEYPSRITGSGEPYKYYYTDDTGTEIQPTVVKL